MIGRRVATLAEIERPGDYCGPIKGYTGDKEACFYILPTCPASEEHGRHLSHIAFPPHTYRECPDGSLEIRNSILHHESIRCPGDGWHGYLDEGHSWRQA